MRRLSKRTPVFLLVGALAVVVSGLVSVAPGGSAAGVTVRPAVVRGGGVAFRFSGLKPCETVIANARILALLGPQVAVVVHRGPALVARDGWLACTQAGRYQPWGRPTIRGGDWTARGRKSAFVLTPRLSRPGTYRYTYSVTVDGRRVRRGGIRVVVGEPGRIRVTLS